MKIAIFYHLNRFSIWESKGFLCCVPDANILVNIYIDIYVGITLHIDKESPMTEIQIQEYFLLNTSFLFSLASLCNLTGIKMNRYLSSTVLFNFPFCWHISARSPRGTLKCIGTVIGVPISICLCDGQRHATIYVPRFVSLNIHLNIGELMVGIS